MAIHPTAVVAPGAAIAASAEIGPYCIIGSNVTIADGCRLAAHVNVDGHTQIGAGTVVAPFASLGGRPQSTSYRGEPTRLVIGSNCDIRESVTMNRGTAEGRGVTEVGNNGFFMAYSHVGHDCILGNNIIFANSATLGGHCEVGDFVFFGGLSAAHQFVRIGAQAMIAGCSGIRNDVIPYGLASGQFALLEGMNVVGMRRRGFTHTRLKLIREFYEELFHGVGQFAARLEKMRSSGSSDPAIVEILAFIDAGGKRPLTKANPRKTVASASNEG